MRHGTRRLAGTLLLAFSCGFGPLGGQAAADPDSRNALAPQQEQFFEERVRPVLVKRCLDCHGPQTQENGLRLDSRAAILAGGDTGRKVVRPGNPDQSLLIAAVRHIGELQMPPDQKLPAEEIEALVAWIELGLPWPHSDDAPPAPLTMQQRIELARENHWAYQPIDQPAPPAVRNADWVSTPIDRYVLARLEASGLTPSPPVDRRTLIRRATYDLLGLPPAAEEIETFVEDPAPDAYPRLIDRLLASPRYGEQWGRHWLDVARYADTRGYAFARERRFPYAYTYRDYVIRAFNQDLPYDRFVLEQLAADRLSLDDDRRALAALGFLTVGRRFNNRHDDIDDQIDVVSRGLLGLTVSCARCHHHKYDAIPTEDYYSLYGVFASCHEPQELPLIGTPVETPDYAAFVRELEKLRQKLEQYRVEKHAELLDASRKQATDYLVRAISEQPEELLQKLPFISLGSGELRPKLVERWRSYLQEHAQPNHPVWGPWRELMDLPDDGFSERSAEILAKWNAAPNGAEAGQVNGLVRSALSAQRLTTKIDAARIYGQLLSDAYRQWQESGGAEQAESPLSAETRQLAEILLDEAAPPSIPADDLLSYLNRAERDKHREWEKQIESHQVNHPGAPPRAMVLADNAQPHQARVFVRGSHARLGDPTPPQFLAVLAGDQREPFTDGSGRLELARAIVAPDNPLTSRVIVNRVWMHHFGEPLVETPSDYGARSEPPVHGELLDYLAWRLMDGGWSLKQLHRQLMLSSTYQQASDARAEGRRADPENRLWWRMNRRRLEFENLRDSLLAVSGRLDLQAGGRPVDLMKAPYSGRRAVYGFVDRQDLPNLLRVFDFASPDQSSARRSRTTVPQQALFLMNSPLVIEQAQAVAARPEVASQADAESRLTAIYRRVLARPATAEEVEIGRRFIELAERETPSGVGMSAWEQFVQILLMSNEFTYID